MFSARWITMRRSIRIWTLAMVVGLMVAFPLVVQPVAAHTPKMVGQYELTVGWRVEPPTVGFVNGLDLGIQRHYPNGTTAWVTGVTSLNATLSTGPATSAKHSLDPQSGRPGWYTFDVIPTRPGIYTATINGTLGSTLVGVKVDLDAVGPASDLAFPVPDPTPSDLQGRLDAANAVIAGLQTQVLASFGVAIVGVVLGGIALVRGIRMSQRERKSP
jgi:hypothetical protein